LGGALKHPCPAARTIYQFFGYLFASGLAKGLHK